MRVDGVGLDHLEEEFTAFERSVEAALGSTISRVLDAGTIDHSASHMSVDDLNVIIPAWTETARHLAEQVRARFVEAANEQRRNVLRALNLTAAAEPLPDDGQDEAIAIDPSLLDQLPFDLAVFTGETQASEAYLAGATNRLVGIGDDLWSNARTNLVTGMQAGESIPKIAARVRDAVAVTAPRARTIARTEIVGASNAGSIAFMRQTGMVTKKEWLATGGPRTRPSHQEANTQKVQLNQKFTVGGFPLDHPGDGNGPASEIVNCRCTMVYDTEDEAGVVASGLRSGEMTAELSQRSDPTMRYGDAMRTRTLVAAPPPVPVPVPDDVAPEDDMPWTVTENGGDCAGTDAPWAVILIADGSTAGCYASEAEANTAIVDLQAADAVEDADDSAGTGATFAAPVVSGAPVDVMPGPDAKVAQWSGVIAMEGTTTGDGREFAAGSLTWGILPIPLRWLKDDTHGGIQVNGVVSIGRIDSIERVGNTIRASGVVDLGQPDGLEAARRMGTQASPGFLSGISIDADDPAQGKMEYVYPPECDGADPATMDPEMLETCMIPSLVIFHSGRIRAATLCDIPAFVEAQVYLDQPLGAVPSAPVDDTEVQPVDDTNPAMSVADVVMELTAAAHAIVLPDLPPAEWYLEPEDAPEIGAITITDEGRIFGYLAPRNVAHRGFDRKVTVPLGNVDYSRWMNRQTIVDGGHRIAAGAITMDCGHASVHPSIGARAASEHYDNTCSIVATARIGENNKGVWLAGALMADATPGQVARLLACQLSGDWRPHRERPGYRELCGVLVVPVPGFPMAARGMRVNTEDGQLIASAVPIRFGADLCGCERGTMARPDLSVAAKLVARSVGRDKKARLLGLRGRVKG